MHIYTYNNFHDYLFWDVLQSLSKILMVRQGYKNQTGSKKPPSKQPEEEEKEANENETEKSVFYDTYEKFEERVKIRLELEFENIDSQKKDVIAV